MQVELLESYLRRFRYIAIRVFIWVVHQMHFDIPQKLVIFSEHCNDGNFKVMC